MPVYKDLTGEFHQTTFKQQKKNRVEVAEKRGRDVGPGPVSGVSGVGGGGASGEGDRKAATPWDPVTCE